MKKESKIKKFFKKIGEGIKKVFKAIAGFIKKHAADLAVGVASVGMDTIIFGAFKVLRDNKAVQEAFMINLGAPGVILAFIGCTALSLILNHAIDNYIRKDVTDFFDGIDEMNKELKGEPANG